VTQNVTLAWDQDNDPHIPVIGYTFYYGTLSGIPYSNWVYVADVTNTTVTVSNLFQGATYYFAVSATNAFGESVNSAPVSARPAATTVPQLTFGTSGGQINLGWPIDHTGWRLQVQTNSIGSAQGTDWATVFGSDATNQVFAPITTGNSQVFFRLVYP